MLFQPYHRVGSYTQHFGGLGVGLSLSKLLVELHKGQIWVKSEKGKGSTFGFSVPLEAGGENKKRLSEGGRYENSSY